ncbi:MAG: OB-fold domain-containing protein [Sneathiella sp.]|nr:OB-fold domain-containing protein [Sneathiella sp.]
MYRLIPKSTGLSKHYYSNLETGAVLLQSCNPCAHIWHYPRPVCPACGADSFSWIPASGNGTVASYTIVRHAPSAAFKDAVPYIVAMVDLKEGPRMTGTITGDTALEVQIGDLIKIEIPKDSSGKPGMPVFRSVLA